MYVGIIDQDLIQQKIFNPNLETMQLSTYHKQKKDIVELVIVSKNIEKYDKLYLVKNTNDMKFLPRVIADPRTECIGLGFTNGKYIPRPEIDSLPADTTIYDKYIRAKYETMSKANQKRVRELKTVQHIRVNLGNKMNWVRPQQSYVKIYDTNPTDISGLYEYCNNYKTVKFKFDCYVNNFEDMIKWLGASWFGVENNLYFIGEFNDKEYKQFVNRFQNHKKAPIFTIDLKHSKNLQQEFSLWMNRTLYALTRETGIKIYLPYKAQTRFYNSLFRLIREWNNNRYRGKAFVDLDIPKYAQEEFDKLCKRDYNINRMVRIIPNQYRKESNWDYVN